MTLFSPRNIRLAAFDLDGTLLGPDGKIGPANQNALRRLHAGKVEVVLASGRHPLNMGRFTGTLPFVRWLVSAQGGEVSDAARKQRLHCAYLENSVAIQAFELGLKLGFSPVAYLPDEICAVRDDLAVQHYARLAGGEPGIVPKSKIYASPIFKVLWIGGDNLQCDGAIPHAEAARFTWVRTHPRIVEVVPPGVNKGSALAVLANHLGILPSESVTFGDGENDLPMFAWSGTSVAMPHGWPAALKRATHIAPDGPPENALARAIDLLFPA